MKISVIGLGYVGFANAITFASGQDVMCFDINSEKVDKLNLGIPPVSDPSGEDLLNTLKDQISAAKSIDEAVKDSKFIFICTPTDFIESKNEFNTASVTDTVKKINNINPASTIIVRSTVPEGFTNKLISLVKNKQRIVFMPEFLREGTAINDSINPSRVIIGYDGSFDDLNDLKGLIQKNININPDLIYYMTSNEAEATKLFSNTFLAMRVAFFNELDTYSLKKSLNPENIIKGVSSDPRIGMHYNNPSFGYGGYCLPKDSKQLLKHFSDIPQKLISATIKSNETRKRFLAEQIINTNSDVIGIYRLVMKVNSDNFRSSSVIDILRYLKAIDSNKKIIIYDPLLKKNTFMDCTVENL